MRVLVTGGAGFIGATLCRLLDGLPGVDSVVALDDLSTGDAGRLRGTRTELVTGSILDRGCVARAAAGADAVVHLAARVSVPACDADPQGTHAVNVEGTRAVLAAARAAGAHRVVLASSAAVYGPEAPCPAAETAGARPAGEYGLSKLRAERCAFDAAAGPGAVLALRLFNVFGPLQRTGPGHAPAVASMVEAALAGAPVPVSGDGRQTRDFVYVRDVCAVMARGLLARSVPRGPVNVGTGRETSLADLGELVGRCAGSAVRRQVVTGRPREIMRSRADVRRLQQAFPGAAATPLAQALTATVQWARAGAG